MKKSVRKYEIKNRMAKVTNGIYQFLKNIKLANPPASDIVTAFIIAIWLGVIFFVSSIHAIYI